MKAPQAEAGGAKLLEKSLKRALRFPIVFEGLAKEAVRTAQAVARYEVGNPLLAPPRDLDCDPAFVVAEALFNCAEV